MSVSNIASLCLVSFALSLCLKQCWEYFLLIVLGCTKTMKSHRRSLVNYLRFQNESCGTATNTNQPFSLLPNVISACFYTQTIYHSFCTSFSWSHSLSSSPLSPPLPGPENTVPVGLLYLITHSALWSTVNDGAKSPQNKIHSGGPCITQLSPGTNQAMSMPVALEMLAGPKAARGSERDRSSEFDVSPWKRPQLFETADTPPENMRGRQTATAERRVSDLRQRGECDPWAPVPPAPQSRLGRARKC